MLHRENESEKMNSQHCVNDIKKAEKYCDLHI